MNNVIKTDQYLCMKYFIFLILDVEGAKVKLPPFVNSQIQNLTNMGAKMVEMIDDLDAKMASLKSKNVLLEDACMLKANVTDVDKKMDSLKYENVLLKERLTDVETNLTKEFNKEMIAVKWQHDLAKANLTKDFNKKIAALKSQHDLATKAFDRKMIDLKSEQELVKANLTKDFDKKMTALRLENELVKAMLPNLTRGIKENNAIASNLTGQIERQHSIAQDLTKDIVEQDEKAINLTNDIRQHHDWIEKLTRGNKQEEARYQNMSKRLMDVESKCILLTYDLDISMQHKDLFYHFLLQYY